MYIPPKFKEVDMKKISDFIQANSFATLVTVSGEAPVAVHIPVELETNAAGEQTLTGHVARANPIWKHFDGGTVLVIFTGPHAYVSSTWYTHINVPTWDYIAVHITGRPRIVGGAALYKMLQRLIQKYEADSSHPATIKDLPRDFLKREIRGIVGFEIIIAKVEAAYKLSPNRNPRDFKNIITELNNRGDQNSLAIAREMEAQKIRE